MTTQTKEQQAVALGKKHGLFFARDGDEEVGPILVGVPQLLAMLADHAKQVREAHTAELVAWLDAEAICNFPEVEDAIRTFLDDQTGDNATGMAQAILNAATPPANSALVEALRAIANLDSKTTSAAMCVLLANQALERAANEAEKKGQP